MAAPLQRRKFPFGHGHKSNDGDDSSDSKTTTDGTASDAPTTTTETLASSTSSIDTSTSSASPVETSTSSSDEDDSDPTSTTSKSTESPTSTSDTDRSLPSLTTDATTITVTDDNGGIHITVKPKLPKLGSDSTTLTTSTIAPGHGSLTTTSSKPWNPFPYPKNTAPAPTYTGDAKTIHNLRHQSTNMQIAIIVLALALTALAGVAVYLFKQRKRVKDNGQILSNPHIAEGSGDNTWDDVPLELPERTVSRRTGWLERTFGRPQQPRTTGFGQQLI